MAEMADLAILIRGLDVRGVTEEVSSRMVTSKSSFKGLQHALSSLLFGATAVITPSQSLRLILDCLEHACMREAAAEDCGDEGSDLLPRLPGNPTSIRHLMVEIVVPRNITEQDLRGCSGEAAAFVARRCLVQSNARLAAKVVQNFSLRSEDFSDWQAVVDYVSDLLTDRGTFSPAVSLLMNLEVNFLQIIFP